MWSKTLVLLISLSSCGLLFCAESAVISDCGPEASKCDDGSCINRELLCNGVPDCQGEEDEKNCKDTERKSVKGHKYCEYGDYMCGDGYCVYAAYVCDHDHDCWNGEDEYHCYWGGGNETTTYDPWSTWEPYTTYDPWSTWEPYTTYDPWSTWDPYTTYDPYPTSPHPTYCISPFTAIGKKCISVEPLLEGTWHEARYHCESLSQYGYKADLVTLDSLDSYAELIDFLHRTELTTRDYWVGARDEHHEGYWEWINGARVYNGTPLWAIYKEYYGNTYSQEPNASASIQDCGYLDKTRFFYMDDEECTKQKSFICEMPSYFVDQDPDIGKVNHLELLEKEKDAAGEASDPQDSLGISLLRQPQESSEEKAKEVIEQQASSEEKEKEVTADTDGDIAQSAEDTKVTEETNEEPAQEKQEAPLETGQEPLAFLKLRVPPAVGRLRSKMFRVDVGNMNVLPP